MTRELRLIVGLLCETKFNRYVRYPRMTNDRIVLQS